MNDLHFYFFYNKLPHIQWIKTQIHYFIALDVIGCHKHALSQQKPFPTGDLKGESIPCPSQLLEAICLSL